MTASVGTSNCLNDAFFKYQEMGCLWRCHILLPQDSNPSSVRLTTPIFKTSTPLSSNTCSSSQWWELNHQPYAYVPPIQSIWQHFAWSHFISLSHYLPFNLWGSQGCNRFIHHFSRGCGGYWSQLSLWANAGYTLDESPAHHRALTDGRGRHARCQLHIRSNFGVQYLARGYFNMQLSSAPKGGGIWSSKFPALPAELQPLLSTLLVFCYTPLKSVMQQLAYIPFISVKHHCLI